MKRVILHIDSIVLQGIAASDRPAFMAAFEAQLGSALAGASLAAMPGPAARIDAGRVSVGPGAGAGQIGTGVARRVAGKMLR